MTPIPEKYKTEKLLKFKDRSHFKKMVNLFFAILLLNVAAAVYMGLKNNVYLWIIDAGIFLTFACFIYALENLPVAIAASLVAGLSVLITFCNSLFLGESWSAFLLALSFEICFFCQMCFIYVHKSLQDE